MDRADRYLKVSLSVVWAFVGLKMLAADLYNVPIGVSLGVTVLVLGVSMAASWWWPRTAANQEEPAPLAPKFTSRSTHPSPERRPRQ